MQRCTSPWGPLWTAFFAGSCVSGRSCILYYTDRMRIWMRNPVLDKLSIPENMKTHDLVYSWMNSNSRLIQIWFVAHSLSHTLTLTHTHTHTHIPWHDPSSDEVCKCILDWEACLCNQTPISECSWNLGSGSDRLQLTSWLPAAPRLLSSNAPKAFSLTIMFD